MVRREQVFSYGLVCLALVLIVFAGLQFITGAGKDRAENATPLMLGTNVWPGYEPLYLARSLGHYDNQAIRLVEYSSASQVIREFRNNTIQAAALTLDEALLLKERGLDFRVILITDISHGADAIVAHADIPKLVDLRGRKVGVEHTAMGAYVLARALRTVDLSISDVDIIPIEVDEHEQAFAAGKVEAVVTFDPVRTRLLSRGAIQLFDSTQIPGEIVDVLVIRADAIEEHRSQVEAILAGWFEALDYLHKQPEDASRRMSARLQLSADEVLALYKGLKLPSLPENVAMLEGKPVELLETANQLARVMKEAKLLQTEVLFDECISVAPLKALLKR